MNKVSGNYSISLDIGTNSVGWAVTDRNYRILKYHGKNMWGVRLFEEGQTAADRRMNRGSRRRIKRRKQRIALLRELIGDMVLAEDPQFFVRLDHAFLTNEDRGYQYNLFNDKDFKDTEYYQNYKTIYHLRKELCESEAKADPRLIYLALHHIIKYRGNFLYEGQEFEVTSNHQVFEDLKEALEALKEIHAWDIDLSEDLLNKMKEKLCDCTMKKSDKKDKIIGFFVERDKDVKGMITEIVSLLLGNTGNLTKLFPKSGIQKDEKDYKTSFDSKNYDSERSVIEAYLQDDFVVVEQLHNVYSFCLLQDILKGEKFISDAMIRKYDDHHNDLKELQDFIREHYSADVYNRIFRRKDIKGNYYSYMHNIYDSKKQKTAKDEFYAFIKKILSDKKELEEHPVSKKIKEKIEEGTYFPRQNSKDNGEIPCQIHEQELIKIIENQKKYYPQLRENEDKILALFRFRIPYYVGPLNEKSKFSWISRKGIKESIRPWTFEEEVDLEESAERFIKRMTNTCTYLIGEPVVPKCSLLYSRYEVLNELNKIKIETRIAEKPQRLTPEVKDRILNELFLKQKKVTGKHFQAYLEKKQYYGNGDIIRITGFQKEDEFASSLAPWIDFMNIYGEGFKNSFEEIETLIEWLTVYEDKVILKKRIKREFPHLEGKISAICKLKYKGWGRLSKKLLCDLKGKKDGEKVSIMDCLENTSMNFMQIITDKKLGFYKLIEEENDLDIPNGITYKMVNDLQGSPALRKAVWQTVKIVEELVHVMKKEPENIFIEFAREDKEKKRTDSRVKKLKNIYKVIEKDGLIEYIKKAYPDLRKEDERKGNLEERLYLYYLQEGKCMYTQEPLDINSLHMYEVDHILPQSYIKDDSIDNKALVLKKENQHKGDQLLLSGDIIRKQIGWWEHLHKYKLISDKKFKNLTRTYISEKEELSFINRQLVETRQVTKHVANLFKNYYINSQIVSIKASLSSIFREKYKLYKIREINDYHHAQDAYLASVIGTFVLRKYPTLQKEFIFTEYSQLERKKQKANSTKERYGFIINQIGDKQIFQHETGELIWDGEETLKNVKKAFSYKDCLITKKPEEKRGKLFKLTISSTEELKSTLEKNPHKVIPVNKHRSNVTKYGGFTGLEYAYGIAVEYKIKNKIKRTILNAPIHLVDHEEKLIQYLKEEAKADDIKIIKDKILFHQLFETDGGLYTMGSATEWHNARQLLLSAASQEVVYRLLNDERVSDDKLEMFYDEYLQKLHDFYPLMNGVYKKLEENKKSFIMSNKKADIVKELLKITKASASVANLNDAEFKISPSAGRMYNKKIDLNKIEFITQSVTGLFTKRYRL